jgi:hypothetical protein
VSSETRDVPAGTAAGSPAADVVPLPLASADPDAVAGAGRLLRRLEPLHSMIYFAPEVGEELTPLGIEHPRAQYFAQRAAAMGAVGPGVVTATFYNFNPALVARSVPDVWTRADPGLVINARLRAADRALRRLLGDAVDGRAIAETADLARRATEGATPEDRPLYAAHADLPFPDEPHLQLWHAVTLLREHRGDAHLHALVAGGLSGIEALVTHTATGRGFRPEFAQASRGWSPEQWGTAVAGLTERGVLDADGGLSDGGKALRDAVEAHTSRTSTGPWQHLGPDAAARLLELAAPLVSRLLENGAFPGDIFASGSDRTRASR